MNEANAYGIFLFTCIVLAYMVGWNYGRYLLKRRNKNENT